MRDERRKIVRDPVVEQKNPPWWHTLHRMWTRRVGKPGYDQQEKNEWFQLETQIRDALKKGKGPATVPGKFASITVEVASATYFSEVAARALGMSQYNQCSVYFNFNTVDVVVSPNDTMDTIYERYSKGFSKAINAWKHKPKRKP